MVGVGDLRGVDEKRHTPTADPRFRIAGDLFELDATPGVTIIDFPAFRRPLPGPVHIAMGVPDAIVAGRVPHFDLSGFGGELGPRLARRDLEFLSRDPFGLPVAELAGLS